MTTVDHYSFERHRFSTEYMNIGCLVLSFEIVKDTQNKSNCLNGSVKLFFTEHVEKWQDDDWSKILDVEDVFPSDLQSQIFKIESAIWNGDVFEVFVVV